MGGGGGGVPLIWHVVKAKVPRYCPEVESVICTFLGLMTPYVTSVITSIESL